jgi:hypothetical protein
VLVCGTVSGAAGCNRADVETWLGEGPSASSPTASLLLQTPLASTMQSFRERLGPDIHALSLLIYPDHAVLQAQNPRDRRRVDQWVYRHGRVMDPVPVELLGTGKLEDNLFPLSEAEVSSLPRLVEVARQKADMPEGVVTRVLLKRHLPETTEIRFRVFISSERRDTFVDADASGKLIDSVP